LEYKQSHPKLREREEAKLEAERARLETEGRQLRQALLEAQQAKEQALLAQQRAEQQMAELAAARQAAPDQLVQARLASDIVAIEAGSPPARRSRRPRPTRSAWAAALVHARSLEQHRHAQPLPTGVRPCASRSAGRPGPPRCSPIKPISNDKQRAESPRSAKAHDQALIGSSRRDCGIERVRRASVLRLHTRASAAAS
ncbi:MAG: hypothetical protein LC121_15855, partial [Anaerolineae bacterium]|nr:hypothetical protein [Anaerolineae bacterium]